MPKVAEILEIPATITARGQTTVPAAIRKMLALGKPGHVVFRGLADGTVVIARRDMGKEEPDPVISAFLDFLAKDMSGTPGRIVPAPPDLVARGRALVEGVDVDLDSALPADEA